MKNPIFCWITILLFPFTIQAQNLRVTKIEPQNWWNQMANDTLQIMLYGNDLQNLKATITDPNAKIINVYAEDKNYAFVHLILSKNCPAKNITINLSNNKGQQVLNYPILQNPKHQPKGFNTSDLVYLIMPDRFSNGNKENDNVAGMEQMNRNKVGGRHGGDLQGISNHLDYIKDLGVTSIWLTPFTEMNDSGYSYHTYGSSNFYEADARYASGKNDINANNEVYKQFVSDAHKKELKVIMDIVTNHIGAAHPWITQYPRIKDWIHDSVITNFQISLLTDPYAPQSEKDRMENGWFWSGMPDLNQNNPRLAMYLVQNNIWWINYASLDGLRLDTQPFSQKDFLTYWNGRLKQEFPTLDIVGEVLSVINVPSSIAYWKNNLHNKDGYNSGIGHVMDFPLRDNVVAALKQNDAKLIYNTIAQDYIMDKPEANFVLLGNHDFDRCYTVLDSNFQKYILGTIVTATTRGIPQLYYGDEIAMTGTRRKDDGYVRADMPGGWTNDALNIFNGQGYNANDKEIKALNFNKKIWNWRKQNKILHEGKLMHYYPHDNVYLYKRYLNSKAVIVALNFSNDKKVINTKTYSELFTGYKTFKNVMNEEKFILSNTIELDGLGYLILEAE